MLRLAGRVRYRGSTDCGRAWRDTAKRSLVRVVDCNIERARVDLPDDRAGRRGL